MREINKYLFINTNHIPVEDNSYFISNSTVIPRKIKPKFKQNRKHKK